MPLGQIDWTGYESPTGVRITGIASRRPHVRWNAECTEPGCNHQFVLDHNKVENAGCPARRFHDRAKPAALDTNADDFIAAKLAAKEERAAKQALELAATERRMRADLGEDADKPGLKRLRDVAIHTPMGDRERESYREFKREFDEEQERPLKEATAQFKATADALARARRDMVLTRADDKFYVTDWEAQNIYAAQELSEEALEFTQNENIKKFRAEMQREDYMPTERNAQLILDYCSRNYCANNLPIGFILASVLIRAFARLRTFALLEEVQHINIEPEPAKENYFEAEERRQREAEAKRQEEQSRTGVEPLTGNARVYTAREIRLMSADTFKRCFFSKIHLSLTDYFNALSK